jgi:hypothetical protein
MVYTKTKPENDPPYAFDLTSLNRPFDCSEYDEGTLSDHAEILGENAATRALTLD